MNALARGAVAGTAGTAALNVVSYLDMALRARPASEVPQTVVAKLAEKADVEPLKKQPDEKADEAPKNRREAAGALLGYVDGMTSASVYGLLRPALRAIPWPIAGVLLGAANMAVGDGGAIQLGATDPKKWSAIDWASAAIPRLVFGLMVAGVYEALDDAA